MKVFYILFALMFVACGGSEEPTLDAPSKPCWIKVDWLNGRRLNGGVIRHDQSYVEPWFQITLGAEVDHPRWVVPPDDLDIWIYGWVEKTQTTKGPNGIYWAKYTIPYNHRTHLVRAFESRGRCEPFEFIYGIRP